ncbi:VanZ family protein [Oceanobacillus sp. CFH 90083]|uniref:VanZ family protein n=1 Tax=Oceanobacillus sp. CFH 90083 TaxID=2592336 RepID=UPI00128D1A19|nr:VanZ family protein [Oceanobacillus sp. CFH 90083]
MEFLLFVFLPVVLFYVVYKVIKKRFDYVVNEIINIAFLFYCLVLIYIVWFFRAHVLFEDIQVNLIPFYSIFSYIYEAYLGVVSIKNVVFNVLGNIVLTFPIGLYLYFNRNTCGQMVIMSFIIPIIIECGQLFLHVIGFTTRSVDVDDIILNSTGIILGYLVAKRFLKVKKSKFIN